MKKNAALLCAFAMLFSTFAHLYGQPAPDRSDGRDFIGEALAEMERAFAAADAEPTLEDAHFLGRAVAAHIFAMHEPYRNPELTRYVNLICQVLVINSPRPVAFRGFFVTVLDTPEFNAFATPGGHIFLTRGLVEAAESEDMLAAVIAHELAHVMLDHGLSMIREMAFVDDAARMARRAADFAGGGAEAERLMDFRDSVSAIFDALVRNGYSREQEFAADRKALELLAAAGYNPEALLYMLRILEQRQGENPGGLLDTHPSPAERIANVETALRQMGAWTWQTRDTGAYRRARFIGR